MKKFKILGIDPGEDIPAFKIFLWNDKQEAYANADASWFIISTRFEDIEEVEDTMQFILIHSINDDQKRQFYDQMWDYIKSGLSISDAVTIISKNVDHSYYRNFLEFLSISLVRGWSLYDAINSSEYAKQFEKSELELIKIWEQSSNLPQIFLALYENNETKWDLKRALKSALIMPVIVFFVLWISMFVIFTQVLPKILLLVTWEMQLPFFTGLLVDIKDLFLNHWFLLLIGFLSLFIIPVILYRFKSSKYYFQLFLMKLPWVGGILKTFEYLIISKVLELSTLAWFSPDEKARMLIDTTNNEVYRRHYLTFIEHIQSWNGFSEIFNNKKLFQSDLQIKINLWDTTQTLYEQMKLYGERLKKLFALRIADAKVVINSLLVLLTWIPVLIIVLGIYQLSLSAYSLIK